MCDCYQIGGPWIAENPNCPEHGHRAVAAREERDDQIAYLEQRLILLSNRVHELETLAGLNK